MLSDTFVEFQQFWILLYCQLVTKVSIDFLTISISMLWSLGRHSVLWFNISFAAPLRYSKCW